MSSPEKRALKRYACPQKTAHEMLTTIIGSEWTKQRQLNKMVFFARNQKKAYEQLLALTKEVEVQRNKNTKNKY